MKTTAEIRTPRELGALIRERRRSLNLAQAALAARVGTTRRWIIDVERGKAGAELGLVLQTLQALGLNLMVETPDAVVGNIAGTASIRFGASGTLTDAGAGPSDIDSIVERARRR